MNTYISKNETAGTQAPQGIIKHVGDDVEGSIIPYVEPSESILEVFPGDALYSFIFNNIQAVIPVQKKTMVQRVGIYHKGCGVTAQLWG